MNFVNNVSRQPLLSYKFNEGVGTNLYSTVMINLPVVNLSVSNINNIQWMTNGLKIINPSIAESTNFSSALFNRIVNADGFSVETWVTPNNITQAGPARIVSISTNTSFRNFTLGPSGSNYVARIRTTTTSSNGIPELVATNVVTANKTHIVYTRKSSGETDLYINGVKRASAIIGGDLSNWDDGYELLFFNEKTHDRPWIGTIHSLSIFDYYLNESIIKNMYN